MDVGHARCRRRGRLRDWPARKQLDIADLAEGSRPRLLVKSGETASINVGNENPVVTRTTDSNQQTEGTTNVMQVLSYRKMEVQIEIKPLVQANRLVDLAISQ